MSKTLTPEQARANKLARKAAARARNKAAARAAHQHFERAVASRQEGKPLKPERAFKWTPVVAGDLFRPGLESRIARGKATRRHTPKPE